MKMKIDLGSPNLAMISLLEDPNQIITLDANFIIPPNRSEARGPIKFSQFKDIWIEPIFKAFPNLAIHEAVYEEFMTESVKCYIDDKVNAIPPLITIHRDSDLNSDERVLRDTIEETLSNFTKYDPALDNSSDRGEVKSLSFMAVKGLLYFAAHDSTAIQLIEKSTEWNTGLDNVNAIKMYELIYYLLKTGNGDKDSLRMLYKYQYYLTAREKSVNFEWGIFIQKMDEFYFL